MTRTAGIFRRAGLVPTTRRPIQAPRAPREFAARARATKCVAASMLGNARVGRTAGAPERGQR
jgi:hypothetical protein